MMVVLLVVAYLAGALTLLGGIVIWITLTGPPILPAVQHKVQIEK